MVDLLSILKTIYGLANKINELVGKIQDNREGCKRLLGHIHRVSAIVKWLQQILEGTTNIVDGDGHQMMSDALKGLKETLERSHKDILDCHEKKGGLMRAINANAVAKKLCEIADHILETMMEAIFATVALNFSRTAEMHADVKKLVHAVHARDGASIRSKLPSVSKQIVEGLPDLPPQVRESVKIYSNSIQYQNNDKREANKTMVHSSVKICIEKNNVPVDRKASLASLSSDGSANKSSSMKSDVAGQGRPKASPAAVAGSIRPPAAVAGSIRPSLAMSYGDMGCAMGRPRVDGSFSSGTALASTSGSGAATSSSHRVPDGLTMRRSLATKTNASIRHPSLSKTNASIRRPSLSKLYGDEAAMSTRQNGGDKMQARPTASPGPPGRPKSSVAVSSGPTHLQRHMEHGETSGSIMKSRIPSLTSRYSTNKTSKPVEIIVPTIIETGIPLRSIDVHPTTTWVAITSDMGGCVIWDYQKKKKVMELPFKKVCSAKFIVQKEWLAVGTRDGLIYIYSYTGTGLREVYNFKADDDGKAINSLAVHPRKLYILSSSDFSPTIMQWLHSRDNKWIRHRTIDSRTVGVHGLKYDRWDAETFVVVTHANTARIYSTEFSSHPVTILEGSSSADYYPTDSNQHLIVTSQNASSNCEIRNLQTGKVVHTLQMSGRTMNQVACHTKQPILATSTFVENKNKGSTTLEDGTICLWDANTYRLLQMVQIPGMGSRHHTVFATDTSGLTRLFVMFGTKIAIVEVNLPVANTSRRTGCYG